MIGDAFARLSTGLKMLIILSAALLPLGLIAVVASAQATEGARQTRLSEARAMLEAAARLLDDRIDDDVGSLRRVALGMAPSDQASCRAALAPLAAGDRGGFALLDPNGAVVCTAGTVTRPDQALLPGPGKVVTQMADDRLRFAVRIFPNGPVGVGEYGADLVRRVVRPVLLDRYLVTLGDNGGVMRLKGSPQPDLEVSAHEAQPIAAGPARIELTVTEPPIKPVEILTALLPILMWLAAAVIGWLVVDRLLLGPLIGMQRAVRSYRAGDGPLTLPNLTTPALEIRALGDAFEQVTARLTEHEAELEQGLARQIRLTREVHHRVKNNLQVVASLINLHARGVDDPAVINAYASIQRRVDALAVVHRYHYAELEENRGVAMRALVGELAANLRATAPPRAAHLGITLDLMPAYVSQDVAVPVAFLITEIVELAMECDPDGRLTIRVAPAAEPNRATLSIAAPGLAEERCADHPALARHARVTEGLARQLRAKLRREEGGAQIAIEIAINPSGESETELSKKS